MMDEGARLINNMFQVISMSLQFRRGYYYGNRKIDWASILCVKVFVFFFSSSSLKSEFRLWVFQLYHGQSYMLWNGYGV